MKNARLCVCPHGHRMDLLFAKLTKRMLGVRLRKQLKARSLHWCTHDVDVASQLEALQQQLAGLTARNEVLQAGQQSIESLLSHQTDLYDGAPVGICTLDRAGVICELNAAGIELLGGPRERLVGKSLADFVAESDRARFATHIDCCIAGEGRMTTELALLSEQFTSLFVQLVSVPAREHDLVTGCSCSLVNISGRRKAEVRLRLLSEAGQKLAGSLGYRGVLSTVVRLAVPTFADLCMLDLLAPTGELERVEVAADGANKLASAWSARSSERVLPRAVILSGRSVLFEEHPLRADDARGLWEVWDADSMMVVPVRARGRTFGTLTFVTIDSNRRFAKSDVPFAEELARRAALAIENALLHDRAQQAVQTRDELLQMVSHDLQNPLAVIAMTVDLMLQAAPLIDRRAETRESLGAIQLATDRMTALVGDLLDLATLDAGVSMHVTKHALCELVNEAVKLMQPVANQRKIRLHTALPPDQDLAVDCDRNRILQVLCNIIGNSLKFTPADGSVSIRVSAHGSEAQVSIEDTGAGIPDDVLPHIFERFWHGEQPVRSGTGLGLAICKLLVDEHHGRLWAEPGRSHGSALHFTLPIHAAHDIATIN